MSRIVKFDISECLLREALHMPDDCVIGGISIVDKNIREVIVSIPDGNDFTVISDITKVIPKITKEADNYKWDWNLPEDKDAR